MPSSLPLWTIWLTDARGNRKTQIETPPGFSISRIANGVGWFNIPLPPSFNRNAVRPDDLLEFWFRPIGASTPLWFNTYFARKFQIAEAANGEDVLTISGPDIMDLLARRIVAWAAGTAQAYQTDEADDMIKAISTQNLGGTAGAGRDLTDYGFTVGGNNAAATSITKGFAWRNVLSVAQDIANSVRSLGDDLYFMIIYTPTSTTSQFKVVTAIGQPGRDRTGDNTTVFGKEWGNLYSPSLIYDYTEEANYIYAGGQGEGSERLIEEVYDLQRMQMSVFNRREAFHDCRNMATSAAIQSAGYNRLAEMRPRVRFSGRLGDTEQTRYGLQWQWGDKVNVTYNGIQFKAVVKSVQINVSEAGQTIEARVESDETLTEGAAA